MFFFIHYLPVIYPLFTTLVCLYNNLVYLFVIIHDTSLFFKNIHDPCLIIHDPDKKYMEIFLNYSQPRIVYTTTRFIYLFVIIHNSDVF
jgi:hypothetical protein